MASMPSFDPNSFSSGIGVAEYKWLSQNDHVPLRNKTLSGLYPPGSTVKPMVAMSFLEAGLPASATTFCRSEEHTSELQSLMRISYAVFCLKKKKTNNHKNTYR